MRRLLVTVLVAAAVLPVAVAHATPVATDYPVATAAVPGAHVPGLITAGPGGALWYADSGTSFGIGRMSTLGEPISEIPTFAKPFDLYAGADGVVTFTEASGVERRLASGAIERNTAPHEFFGVAADADGIVRWAKRDSVASTVYNGFCVGSPTFASSGSLCQLFPGSVVGTRPTDMTLGPDGKLWITLYEEDRIVRWSAAGGFDLTLDLPTGSGPARIAAGPDGNMWATAYGASAIDRITPAGVRTRFPLPAGRGPNDIAAGPDGALWFTEFQHNAVGRMTTAGVLTDEVPSPTPASGPYGITPGPDGALWFTENIGRLGRIVPDPPPAPPTTAGQTAGPAPDTVAPVFTTGLRSARARFRVGRAPTALSAARRGHAVPTGTTLSFSLSEPARVTLVIAARRSGVRVGRACRARARGRAGASCVRVVPVGTLSRTVVAGASALRFTGRLGSRALTPGGYQAAATATDPAGNRSAPSGVRFTIVG